ncbi:MAG TPA: lysophospholipid acyltransferase family protein [Candidatus Nanoarchaeia archaeon]|nr:lysophospholipid acyltransferase family protein [Candidatus Nanoarchaeia archaeon]
MVYFFAKKFLVPVFRLWIKDITGVENILENSQLIIAANHSSYVDHLFLCSIVIPKTNKKLHFLAKKEHFDSLAQRLWHNYAGAIPLDRQAGGKEALKQAIKELKQKKIIGIYPEGTRTLDGKMQRAKTGVARLALLSKAPVVPVGLIGTFEIMPKGKYLPRLKSAKVNIGKPITFEKYYGKRITKKLLREVTNIIMKEIARLSKQKYNFD